MRSIERSTEVADLQMHGSPSPVAIVTGNQVQQAIWSQRRKKKKLEASSGHAADLAIMTECGIVAAQRFRRLEWRWTCCDALSVAAAGCGSGHHA